MSFEMPAVTVPGPVTIRVQRDAVETFYTDTVGLDRLSDHGDATILGAGDTPILVLERDANAPARGEDEAGLYHTAIRVPDRAALGAVMVHLEDQDIEFGAADHGVSEALYLEDPAGNGAEIYRDRDPVTWAEEAGHVVMETAAIDRDALRDAAGTDRMPDGGRVGHVHLEVTDLDASLRFYRDVLGFRVRATWDGARFLAAGDYHHHVGLNTWHGRSRPRSTGHLGVAAVTWHVPEISALEQQLKQEGGDYRDMANGLAVSDPNNIEHRFLEDADAA